MKKKTNFSFSLFPVILVHFFCQPQSLLDLLLFFSFHHPFNGLLWIYWARKRWNKSREKFLVKGKSRKNDVRTFSCAGADTRGAEEKLISQRKFMAISPLKKAVHFFRSQACDSSLRLLFLLPGDEEKNLVKLFRASLAASDKRGWGGGFI